MEFGEATFPRSLKVVCRMVHVMPALLRS